jgi:hypothetical protein
MAYFRFFQQILKVEKTGDASQIRNINESSVKYFFLKKKITRDFFLGQKMSYEGSKKSFKNLTLHSSF